MTATLPLPGMATNLDRARATSYDPTAPVDYPPPGPLHYLSGVRADQLAGRPDFGLMLTPGCSTARHAWRYQHLAIDNGAYGAARRGEPHDATAWLAWIDTLPRDRTLFAVLPDVLTWTDTGPRGDAAATIARGAVWRDRVAALGFAVAIAAQDGMTTLDAVPYPVDAVFIAGSDAYKTGPDARRIATEAHERGLWLHLARVNTLDRLTYAAHVLDADSADGTGIAYTGPAGATQLAGWLDDLNTDTKEHRP